MLSYVVLHKCKKTYRKIRHDIKQRNARKYKKGTQEMKMTKLSDPVLEIVRNNKFKDLKDKVEKFVREIETI